MAEQFLKVTSGPAAGTEIELEGEFRIGRTARGSGTLGDDPELSREHARVTRYPTGELLLEDLGSTNGTFLNDRKIDAATPVRAGDRIRLGTSTLEVVGTERAGERTRRAEAPPAEVTRAPSPPPAPPPEAPTVAPFRPFSESALRIAKQPEGEDDPPGRHGVVIALATAAAGILIGGMIAAAIFANDDDGTAPAAASTPEMQFAALAQGFSEEEFDEQTMQRELDLELEFLDAPFDLRDVEVNKFLDESMPPPQPVTDAVYVLTAENGDTLTLEAEGVALPPGPPDDFFGRADEDWTVTEGTGRFQGASGEGKVLSSVDVAGRSDPVGSNVVKYFVGTLNLNE